MPRMDFSPTLNRPRTLAARLAESTMAVLTPVMKRDKNLVWRRVDAKNLDLKGMKIAIVGGTGGIGRALSRFMASRGASILVVGQTFRDSDLSGVEFIKADLSLMHEAQRVAAALPADILDLVIFTTGIMAGPKRQETAEGIERDMAVSYLSRLVIVREIGPRLGKQRPATPMKPRVFIMGFPGTGQAGKLDDLNTEKSYSRWTVHMKDTSPVSQRSYEALVANICGRQLAT